MKNTQWLFALVAIAGLILVAGQTTPAAAHGEPARDEAVPVIQVQDAASAAEDALSTSEEVPTLDGEKEPTLLSSFRLCEQSYDQCTIDCQHYSQPTRNQCLAWCYQTHWCAQV